MGRGARAGIMVGVLLIAALAVAIGVWAYRPDYQVLFADMAPRDAAAMAAELDKSKTPYQLEDGGAVIMVPRELVYKTRLKLMAKDVPLHGAVGFEVFNNADFGMTEFVQKVNYLRAIQGELTRTILSIDDILAARVHLAIPEQGLFKKAATKPKASVTLTLKPGRVLSAEQVAGIQRLVAASVPDIVSADVTLLDQHGVALTRLGGGDDGAADGGGQQLDAKRSTEDYLVKKVAAVLDRTFGAGQAVASVDVALSLDHGKVTTEEVLPAKMGLSDGSPTGVVVREKHTVRDADSPGLAGAKPGGGNSSAESDYQVGRRVEQLAIAGGTVRRMTIAVVVKPILSDAQLAQLREVVALAVGFNSQRGDAIVVNSMDRLVSLGASADGQPPAAVPALDAAAAVVAPPLAATRGTVSKVPDRASADIVVWVLAALLLACVAAALAYAGLRRRAAHRPAPALLDEAARARMIVEVRRWIATPSTVDAAAGVRK